MRDAAAEVHGSRRVARHSGAIRWGDFAAGRTYYVEVRIENGRFALRKTCDNYQWLALRLVDPADSELEDVIAGAHPWVPDVSGGQRPAAAGTPNASSEALTMKTADGIVRAMGWIVCGIMTAFLACGGKGGNGSSDGGSSPQPANPCASMSFTYGALISEQPGGTCGGPIVVLPSHYCDEKTPCEIKVNADGTLNLPTNVTCASFTVTGCTTRGSDCTYTSNGESFTENFEITFAEQGVAANGTVSITGIGNGVTGTGTGKSCSSTYDVAATRQ